ncbi:NUDIX domain-containing protein [Glycomyces tenuis]|uniref:NUDIX domain-containing protein n=1 Tax=Glycomyces tenuis TaxID=58116 RepID=UPI00041ECDA0|nr:NUDIX hydrolase [Glycomyces tenuis]
MSESPNPEQGVGAAEHTHTMTGKRLAATVLFTDGQGRVLLCEPVYKQVWEAPGGAVEADESPRKAAAREVGEELGLEIEPGRLVAVDWVPPMDGRTESMVYVFDGGRLDPGRAESIRLPADELGSWEWCTIPQAHERMRPLVARRIEAALAAVETGTTVYLEAGYPVG